MLRKCTHCGLEAHTEADMDAFTVHKNAKYGRRNFCKACDAKTTAEYYKENKDSIRVTKLAWQRANPHKVRALVAKRRGKKLQATPAWADFDEIESMYMEAAYHNMEVDHIVPLNNPIVCGLHWEGNLQLLTREANATKSNKLIEVNY